ERPVVAAAGGVGFVIAPPRAPGRARRCSHWAFKERGPVLCPRGGAPPRAGAGPARRGGAGRGGGARWRSAGGGGRGRGGGPSALGGGGGGRGARGTPPRRRPRGDNSRGNSREREDTARPPDGEGASEPVPRARSGGARAVAVARDPRLGEPLTVPEA